MRRKPLIVPTAVLSSLALAGPVSADDAAPTTAPAAQTAPETPAPVEAPAEVESPETPAPAEAHVEADAQAEVVAPEPAEPEVVPQTEADAVADAEVDAPASPPRTFDGPPIIAAPPDAEPDPWMEKLTARAKDLATRDYQPQPDDLPEFLANLDYVGYREIEFRRDHTLFQGRPFELQFFHRGGYHPRRVAISLITDAERAQTQPAATQPAGAPPTTEQVLAEVDYDPAVWNYRASQPPVPLPVDLGFAGIKVLAALNRPADEPFDELLTFLGASYFRALPKGAAYGLSARGLALNTGAGQEEFPSFTAFWIVEPKPGDTALRIYALLDSPSVAGAYRYDITPGVSTDLEVRSALFFRKNVELVGIAPLTSMFWYDEKNPGARRDHRPEVHDSDALLIHSADGERLFRPLRNPPRPTTTTHHADHLTGFGLIQRDLAYEHYRDDEALYHLRPTAWVTPHGDWGPGNVALYGWPVEDEVDDNVVAFFWPDQPLRAGDHAEFAYTLRFLMGDPDASADIGRFVATRVEPAGPRRSTWNLEAAGGALAQLQGVGDLDVRATATGGRVVSTRLALGPTPGRVTVSLEVQADAEIDAVDLRLFLSRDGHALTETWTLPWTP